MAKQILSGDEARHALLKGVNVLSNVVKATLGPRGKNIVLDKKFGSPPAPRTASPSPRKSSSRTPGRTWAPAGQGSRVQDLGRRRRRHDDRHVLARPFTARACATSRPAPTRP